MLHAVRITNADGSTSYAGKEGWNFDCECPEWVGSARAADAKARNCLKERKKPGKNLTFIKVEVVPVSFIPGDPIKSFDC